MKTIIQLSKTADTEDYSTHPFEKSPPPPPPGCLEWVRLYNWTSRSQRTFSRQPGGGGGFYRKGAPVPVPPPPPRPNPAPFTHPFDISRGGSRIFIGGGGGGLCSRTRTCPTLCPRPTKPHTTVTTPLYPTPCTVTSPRTPSNTTTITNTTPRNANNTSTFQTVIKTVMHAHSFINFWLHKPRHTQHNPYPS